MRPMKSRRRPLLRMAHTRRTTSAKTSPPQSHQLGQIILLFALPEYALHASGRHAVEDLAHPRPREHRRTKGKISASTKQNSVRHRPGAQANGVHLGILLWIPKGGIKHCWIHPTAGALEGGVQHTQRERLVNSHALLLLLENLSWSDVRGRIGTNQSKNVSIQCHPLKRIPTRIHQHVQYANMLCPCVGAVGRYPWRLDIFIPRISLDIYLRKIRNIVICWPYQDI